MKLKVESLKNGDILHCYSTGFLPRMIRWFTGSRVNHTALVIELFDKLYVVDSQADGTNLRTVEGWDKKYGYNYLIHRTPLFTEEQREKALSVIGTTPYDFKSLLWYQPVYILTGRWRGRRGTDAEKRMYCSEYVAWVFDLPNWWKASPEAVKQYMSDSVHFKKVKL